MSRDLPTTTTATARTATDGPVAGNAETLWEELRRVMGYVHPIVAHEPLVLVGQRLTDPAVACAFCAVRGTLREGVRHADTCPWWRLRSYLLGVEPTRRLSHPALQPLELTQEEADQLDALMAAPSTLAPEYSPRAVPEVES